MLFSNDFNGGEGKISRRTCFFILAVITLVVRFPFFFPENDLDESTFILLGHEILKGHLPSVTLWDLKPPLLYGFYAVLQLMGKSIPVVRLAGSFCVLGGAWFVCIMGEKVRNLRTGLTAGLLLIVYATLTGDGATTSSEIVSLLPVSIAMFILLGEERGKLDFFLTGLLISIACMFRLNLAYVALFGCVFLVAAPKLVNSTLSPGARLASYACGGALPVILSILPYWVAGKLGLLYQTCIRAALAYSNSQKSPVAILVEDLLRFGQWHYLLLHSLMLVSFLGGLTLILAGWKNFEQRSRKNLATLILFMIATGISILKSGVAYEQYLIQLLPFCAVIAAFFLDLIMQRRAAPLLVLICAAWLIVPAGRVIAAYRPVIARVRAHRSLCYGPGYRIAAYPRKNNPDNRPVFMMEEAIVYWLDGGLPSSRISAPSLQYRQRLFAENYRWTRGHSRSGA